MRRGRIAALAAVLVTVASLVGPFAGAGYRGGHDLGAHVTYTYLFDQALHQGQFPVRWVEGLRNGYSQPLFNFYQVGLYYLVEIVHLAVPRLSTSLNLTVVALWWTGTAFMFLWLRRLGALPAALGALMFALSPYLLQDVFIRAAYPETAAIAFMPGVLWSLDRLLRTGRPIYAPPLALCLGWMLISHLPASVIVSPLVAAYGLYLVVTVRPPGRSLLFAAAAVTTGVGLAAFYLAPALLELKYISITDLTSREYDYHEHFVRARQWLGLRFDSLDDVSFQLGWSQIAAVVAGVGAVIVRRSTGRRDARVIVLWLSAVAFGLFMMHGAARPLWEALGFLAFIQFPWRFFIVVTIASAALGASLLASVRDERVQAAIVVAAVALHLPLYRHYDRADRVIPREQLNIDHDTWRQTGQAQTFGFYVHGYDPLAVTEPPPAGLERWAVAEGAGTVRPVAVTDAHLLLDVQSAGGMRLVLNSRAFPGWVLRLDGREMPIVARPRTGFMDVTVPDGRHEVEATFTNTPVRTWGDLVTLASAALTLLAAAAAVRQPPTTAKAT